MTSQNEEDGIIDKIVSTISTPSRKFVEFGIGPNYWDPNYERGLEGNCVPLRDKGWHGVFMDGNDHPAQYGINKEFVTALNINGLLKKYDATDCSVLSIDVDGQDFWIWMAIQCRPELVVIEYNPNFDEVSDRRTVPFDLNFRWDGTRYYGASLGALIALAQAREYTLVYANGVNAFFVRSDTIANPSDFCVDDLKVTFEQHAVDEAGRPWVIF